MGQTLKGKRATKPMFVRLASCVNTRLCDRAVADEFFLDYARSFWRFFSTHIERERRSSSANLAVGIETYVKAPR